MKNVKRNPQRTCMGCNQKKDKKDLVRIVKNKENEINVDRTGKLDGRGAYICDNIECLEKVIKTKRLEKAWDIKISQEIYDSKNSHKKPVSKQTLKDKKKSKEEMQEMISLEKAMTQKHKKKVHEENENEVEVKQVVIDSSISVGDLAKKIQKSPAEIVRYLMMNGVLATVNQVIDAKTAKKVAESLKHIFKKN